MNQIASLSLTDEQYKELKSHLFPGDDKEAAAILICRRVGLERERLILSDVILVDHADCARTPESLSWPGSWIEEAENRAERHADTIILLHSHPSGLLAFSRVDDESNLETMPSLHDAIAGDDMVHGSSVMTPDGRMIARIYDKQLNSKPISRINLVGTNIVDLTREHSLAILPFTKEMTEHFGGLTACVIGISGTGSLVTEQLARLGIGRLILVDFDRVEPKNLNRIVNARYDDAKKAALKTHIAKDAILGHHPQAKVIAVDRDILSREAVDAASSADILFSCVDGEAGRSVAELISSTCLVPLVDMGVEITPDKENGIVVGIAEMCCRIDYVRPGGPSLSDRRVITPQGLNQEYLLATTPEEAEIRGNYFPGVSEKAPAVITLNMRAASMGVHEWLCRLFPLRHDGNALHARTIVSLGGSEEEHFGEGDFTFNPSSDIGQGLTEPPLGLPALALQKKKTGA